MLTLSRRTGESLCLEVDALDQPIQIRPDRIRGWNEARLSIDVPKDRMKVQRKREWCDLPEPTWN